MNEEKPTKQTNKNLCFISGLTQCRTKKPQIMRKDWDQGLADFTFVEEKDQTLCYGLPLSFFLYSIKRDDYFYHILQWEFRNIKRLSHIQKGTQVISNVNGLQAQGVWHQKEKIDKLIENLERKEKKI